jgi:hypothetical protein
MTTLQRNAPQAVADWPGEIAPAALAVTFVAEVLESGPDGIFTLQAGARSCQARRAPSCLLEPRAGDRVACWRVSAGDEAAQTFVVAVLERRDSASPARLSVEGDVEWAAPSGSLRLVARDRIGLVAQAIDSISSVFAATVGELKLVGALFSTVFDRETHHAQHHARSVDGVDRLDAEVVDHQARTLMRLHAENVLADGERLVKVRGTQIHFG